MTLERINNKLYNFGSELVGSRILDLYLKYNGIKMLTTATLVPLALILGKDLFEDFIISQKGGKLKIPDDLPIIDDPLIGNSLKFTDVSNQNKQSSKEKNLLSSSLKLIKGIFFRQDGTSGTAFDSNGESV